MTRTLASAATLLPDHRPVDSVEPLAHRLAAAVVPHRLHGLGGDGFGVVQEVRQSVMKSHYISRRNHSCSERTDQLGTSSGAADDGGNTCGHRLDGRYAEGIDEARDYKHVHASEEILNLFL